MENHPIPQNVTGFQFKLIGEMTIKQFAYLAAGCVLTYLLYVLPVNFLIKFPLIALSLGFGVSLAFLPIEGRPLDVMLMNFLRALFAPNQYVFQKIGGQLAASTSFKKITQTQVQKTTRPHTSEELETYLSSRHILSRNPLDEKEEAFSKLLSVNFNQSGQPSAQLIPTPPAILPQKILVPIQKPKEPMKDNSKPVPPMVTPVQISVPSQNLNLQPLSNAAQPIILSEQEQAREQREKEMLDKQAVLIEKELEEAKMQETVKQGVINTEEAHKRVLLLEQKLNETLSEKEHLEKQLLLLSQKFASQKQVFVPTNLPNKLETPNVRRVPKEMGAKIGFPVMPEAPNLITGIVKDSRGNILPSILVEIADKEGNPVRAFKTNSLGQFASATPLSNGTYTLIFEDPEGKHKFDLVEITARGEIISPIEIISTDAREELRKELFGKN